MVVHTGYFSAVQIHCDRAECVGYCVLVFRALSWLRSMLSPAHLLEVVVFVAVVALDAKGWAFLLTLVEGFRPRPLVPQYVQVS